MKLSEQLKQDHECWDFGKALEGYSERAKELEDEIEALKSDLLQALEWNWLDDDYPKELFDALYEKGSK